MKTLLKLYLPIFLFVSSVFAVTPTQEARATTCTPGTGWGYCNSITIDHTKVSTVNGTALTGGFAVEASSTIAQLKTVTNSGHVQNLTTQTGSSFTGQVPADLQFSTSSSFSTLLPGWEFESYASTTGNFVVWLNVGSDLSTTTDTAIYFQYGKSSVTTWQGNVSGTWNSNYAAVWHLPNGSSLNLTDSTSNGNNLNLFHTPSAGNGFIDGAVSLNTTNQNALYANNSTSLNPSSQVTLEGWIKATGTLGQYVNPFGKLTDGGSTAYGFWMNSNTYQFNAEINSTSKLQTSTLSLNNWYLLTMTYDGSTLKIYLNGAANGSQSMSGTISSNTGTFNIGTNQHQANFWNGLIDEVRLASTAYSSDWISTEYNNQSAPDKANYGSGGFYTVGTEQSGGGGPTPLNQLFFGWI